MKRLTLPAWNPVIRTGMSSADSKRLTITGSGILVLLIAFSSILFGQQRAPNTADSIDVTRQRFENLRQDVEKSPSFDAKMREEILSLYDRGLLALSAAEKFSDEADRYEQNRESIPRLIQSLNSQLIGFEPAMEIASPEDASVEKIQQMLQQADAELAVRRQAVEEIQKSFEERNLRRSEINRNIAALDQKIFELESSIESAFETASESPLRQATLDNLAAQRKAAQEEVRALKAELADANLRTPLRLLRRQRAERRVTEAAQRKSRLEEILTSAVSAEIRENLSRLQAETAEAVQKYPGLQVLTDEIVVLSKQLFGPEGIEKRTEPLSAELSALREAHRKLVQELEVSRNKYTALGKRAEVQRWYPVVPPEVPPRNVLERRLEQYATSLADANATLIGLQDRRANLPDMDSEAANLSASLGPQTDENEQIEWQSLCRQLLITRTELLDRLIARYSDYLAKLRDLSSVSGELHEELEQGYEFVLERIFWRRSLAGPLLPRAGDMWSAARWLFANPEWPGSILRSLKGLFWRPWPVLAVVIVLFFLLSGRKRFKQRLPIKGLLAAKSEKPLQPLLDSALMTLFLAAPVPLALAGLGLLFNSPEPAAVAEKFSNALFKTALLTLGLEMIVQIFREGGIAQIQFAWTDKQCLAIRHRIRRMMTILIPLVLVFMSFGGKFSDHVGDPSRIAHLESLGRVAFIAALIAVALTCLSIFRWVVHEHKLSSARFPAAALVVLAGACLSSVLMSILGWHLSAFVLAVLVFRSFFLFLDVALITAFIERLRQIRGKVLHDRERSKLKEHVSEKEENLEASLVKAEIIDVESTNRQVGESIRLGAMVVIILGLFAIWSNQLPSLRFLDHVQLLPSVRILPANPEAAQNQNGVVSAPVGKPDSVGVGAQVSATKPVPPGMELLNPAGRLAGSSLQEKVPTETVQGYSLTLSSLLGAIIVLLLLFVVAKYLPSLLDFFILSRFSIVSGDRKAITKIVSYILVIIGLSAAGARLGLKWSQVQWLAAAFSFGLGFGLQDIFANFFSGLVLLFERPMHVGDMCRFGEQLGTVEAIGLRSTRIRSQDRTVINVPNADFSKKELVNYAKRDRILFRTTIGLRYETTDEQLRYVLVKIRELLLAHPKIVEARARVRFVGFGDYSLNTEIFAYVITKEWEEFLGIQEDVLLRIMRLVEESGTGFAFPSQTTYLSRDSGMDAGRTASAEAEVEAWRSEKELPFPDFSERQRRRFRDNLDFPPIGSPFAKSNERSQNVKKGTDEKEVDRKD